MIFRNTTLLAATRGQSALMLAAVWCGFSSAPLAAQDETNPEIVVEATLNDPARDAAGPRKALGEDRLNPPGAVSITETMSLLPGVIAFEKGGAGAGSYVAIRGGEPNFAPVTINGVRVDDPLNSSGGGFDFSLVEPALVSRIAVVSGPQSTAYGADALSGVIALTIKGSRARDSVNASAGVGAQGRHQLSGALGFAGNAGSLMIAGGYSDNRDFVPGSSLQRYSAMLAASPQLGANASLDLFGMIAGSDFSGFPEDSGGPRLASTGALEERERTQIATGAVLGVGIAPGLTGQMRLGFSRSEFLSDSPGIAPGVLDAVPPIFTDSRFDRYEAVASLTHRPAPWLTVEAGASYVAEDGASDGTLDFGVLIPTAYSLSRDLPGIFATIAAELPGDAQIAGGLRIDWPEGGNARWTPRVGATVPLGDNGVRLFANYARGFKRPSLFALGFPLIANPDLEDERSEVIDAGVEFANEGTGILASATYFHSTYRNLIDFDPLLFTNVNRARVVVEGIEAALARTIGRVRLRGALTRQSVRSDDGAQLRFRPDWTGRLSIRWQASETVAISAHGEVSSAFFDSSVPTGIVRNSGFETLGLDAEWQVSQQITVFAAMRNATNTAFERTVGFPEPGRNAFVGVRTGF